MSWIELAPSFVMRSYLAWCSTLNRAMPRLRVAGIDIFVSPTTCKPIHGEAGLVDAVSSGETVLDLGTGSGIIAIAAARRGASTTASDISDAALADAIANAERNGVDINFQLADCYVGIRGKFDHIFSHLPYIESDIGVDHNSQWAATYPSFVERVIAGASDHLTSSGTLTLFWPKNKHRRVERLASETGLVLRSVEPWHPGSLKLAALRWLYLDIGFASTKYVLEQESREEPSE